MGGEESWKLHQNTRFVSPSPYPHKVWSAVSPVVSPTTDLYCRIELKNDSKVKGWKVPLAGFSPGKVQSKQLARRDATNFLDR